MIYRVTFGFVGSGVGWSETHALLNGTTDPRTLIPTCVDVAQKRAQFLGREFSINTIRISKYSDDAGVRQRGVALVKQTFRTSVTGVSGAAEPAVVALLCKGTATPSQVLPQFDSNTNQTFLGAPFDVSVDNAGEVDQSKGGLGAAFASWKAVMLSTSFGWLVNETVANFSLAGATQTLAGKVLFTADPANPAGVVVGTRYKARVRGINGGVSPLNGELIVTALTASTFQTYETIGLALTQVGGFMRLYRPVQRFADYLDLTLSGQTAKHKRGRPFGFTPGRAPRRIRG